MPGLTALAAALVSAALVVPSGAPVPACDHQPGLPRAVRDVLGVLGIEPPACPPLPRLPGELLDLADWKLTLPIGTEGDPLDITMPGLATYTSDHFRLTADGDGVVFRANAGGVTTENSNYPRSELREMAGTEHASWSNTVGTHVLEVRQAITEVPPVKPEVVAAQIHGGDDDVLQIRLDGPVLSATYADGERRIVLDPAYRLGSRYDLRVVAGDGRITVFHNGERKAEIEQSGSGWYWKIGAYTQSNPLKGDRPDAAGEVVVYSLRIEHTGV